MFLNMRCIYRHLGKKELLISSLFAFTFFATRIVMFGLLVAQIFSHYSLLTTLLLPQLQLSYFVLLPSLYCLNCYWFAKIFLSVMRVVKGGNAAAAGHYESPTDEVKQD